jgi:hypothetical protein
MICAVLGKECRKFYYDKFNCHVLNAMKHTFPGENINLLQVTDKLREFKKCRNFATYIIVRQLILVMTIQ